LRGRAACSATSADPPVCMETRHETGCQPDPGIPDRPVTARHPELARHPRAGPGIAASGAAAVPYPDRMTTRPGSPSPKGHQDKPAASEAGAGRNIAWEGFANARDLGGLPTRDGRVTRLGAYIRSGDLRFVTAVGWQTAREASVRTIIDLRNDGGGRPRRPWPSGRGSCWPARAVTRTARWRPNWGSPAPWCRSGGHGSPRSASRG
jgi:Tyrosine phosphatase family